MAMRTAVNLIITSGYAERDKTTSQEAANEGKNDAANPRQRSFSLFYICHSRLSTELARDIDAVLWPVIRNIQARSLLSCGQAGV